MINHAFEPEHFERDACDHKFDDNGRAGYCGRPKAEHLAAPAETPTVFPKRWPRRVGWKKLQERKAKCRHTVDSGFAIIRFFGDSFCPRCLGDEVAYWKARSRSAEGNAARETREFERLRKNVAEFEKAAGVTVPEREVAAQAEELPL